MTISKGWQSTTLGKLGSFGKGCGLSGAQMTGNEFVTDEFNIPCIGYGDIYMKYNISFDKARNFTSAEAVKTSEKISKGTLLFTATGETALEIGKCVCYRGDEDIYVGGDIITFNSSEVLPEFLAYQQYTKDLINIKSSWAQGHSVVHIREKNLDKLPVMFPNSISEQQKIVEIIDQWQNGIALKTKLIEKLKEQRRGLMQKLLTPKTGWKEIKLNKILKCTKSNHLIKELKNKTGEFPVFGADGEASCNVDFFDFNENTIGIIQWGSGTGRVYYNTGKHSVLGTMAALRLKSNEANLMFMYYYLQQFDFKKYIEISTTPNMYFDAYGKEKVFIPNLDEQNKIVFVLSKIDEQIGLYTKCINQLKKQQTYLLENLLTGQLRVNA